MDGNLEDEGKPLTQEELRQRAIKGVSRHLPLLVRSVIDQSSPLSMQISKREAKKVIPPNTPPGTAATSVGRGKGSSMNAEKKRLLATR